MVRIEVGEVSIIPSLFSKPAPHFTAPKASRRGIWGDLQGSYPVECGPRFRLSGG